MKYTINHLPLTASAFSSMLSDMNNDPEGAAAACVLALNIMESDMSQGKESLRMMNPKVSNSILQLAESQLDSKGWIIRSYFAGTTPENGYTLPEKLEMEFSTNKYSGSRDEGEIKLYIACSGADSPRPITVKQRSDGTWYAHEWSSLIVGIRYPS